MPQRMPSYEASEGHEESTSPKNEKQDEKSKWRLRGLLWRMQLGVLPSPFDSVESLRRASADGRRRYADLRRRLLVDPHLMEEGQKPPDVGMDNPLSLDPDSVWGKYFRNVEIERIIDKDLCRLYPEHGNFFQGSGCQAMFRRILLVWALIHPQLSYRQGMHELLAPLLYVLHMDVLQLSQIKKRYEDLFDDRFDEDGPGYKSSRVRLPFEVSDDQKSINGHRETQGIFEHDELNIDLKVIVMGSDTYGAEGELGALFSARFMEHDAYCMFDALLSGQGGAVRMVDYFATSGVPDASAALFRTLAAADFALYAHLVELGVQPQYFALRWLRLLFGREFVLEDLLLVWDVIFSASNEIVQQQVDGIPDFSISERSAIISAIAVSLLFHSRAALLAAPDATGCLQRLLNFPYIQDVRTFLENAKLLQPLALSAASTPPPPVAKSKNSPQKPLRQTSTSCSPEVLKMFLSAEGYWEGKWKNSVLQKASMETVSEAASKVTKAKRTSNGSAKPVKSSKKTGTRTPAPEEAGTKSDDEPGEVQAKANVNSDSDEAFQDQVVTMEVIEDGNQPIQETRVDEKVVNKEVIRDEQQSTAEDVKQSKPFNQGVVPERQRSAAVNRVERESNSKDATEPAEAGRQQSTVVKREGGKRLTIDEERLKSVDSRDEERSTVVNDRDGERLIAVKEDGKLSKPASKEVLEDGRRVNKKNTTSNGLGAVNEVSIDDPLGVSSSSRLSTPNIEGEEVMNTFKRVSSRSDFLDSPKKGKGPVSLQSLGQAMSEHVQVLEGVLSQKGEQMSKVIAGGKGHVSAMVALAELRKISNALLQM